MVENHHTARRRPPPGEPVRYTVRFPAPQTHYAEVEVLLPTGGASSLDTFLPVWTPGSYLVREVARNIKGGNRCQSVWRQVRTILRSSPAWQSGLNVDDEIIGIGDYRVRADQLSKRLENYCQGDNVTLQIARREQLMKVELTLSAETSQWQLEVLPTATTEQKAQLAAWLR